MTAARVHCRQRILYSLLHNCTPHSTYHACRPGVSQDDFDDLCEALADSLSSSPPVQHHTPRCSTTEQGLPPPAANSVSAVAYGTPSAASSALPGAASAAISTAQPGAIQAKVPAAMSGPALPGPASSADMALLAAQLQALAEEMARLRLGLDRLMPVAYAANRAGPDPGGLGPFSSARDSDTLRAVSATTGSCAAGAAGGAEEARGRALWVQERLLLEAQALLGEMMAGGQPQGAAGVFTVTEAHLRKGPAHAKKARAAAAAATAAAAAAAAATGVQGDRMELAGTRRPHSDDDRAQAGELHHAEFELASYSHHYPVVGQPPEVSSGSWHCSGTGLGRDLPGRDLLHHLQGGGLGSVGTMVGVAAPDSEASQTGADRNNEGHRRGWGGFRSGVSYDEGGYADLGNFSARCEQSACGPGPPGVPSQQPGTSLTLSDATPPWLGIRPAPLPAGAVPAISPASQAAQVGQHPPPADGWPAAAPGPCGHIQGGPWGRECAPLRGFLPSESSGGAAAESGVALRTEPAAPARYCI